MQNEIKLYLLSKRQLWANSHDNRCARPAQQWQANGR